MPLNHVAPRPAATVMLLRDRPEGLEVFMVVRHDAIDFAAGALVFPGGRVESGDHELADNPELCPGPEGLDAMAMAFRAAAIRETFEECGILLARPRGARGMVDAARLAEIEASHRAALCRAEISLADILATERLALATDQLVRFAHWITPASQAKRFDTHFYLARAPEDQAGAHDGAEAVDSTWLRPAEAIAGVEAGRYKMVFPTHMNLAKLGQSRSVAHALETARASTVVTVEPEPVRNAQGLRQLRIPLAAGYGGEVFTVTLPPAMPRPEAG